jgi:hypothetical protein
MAVTTILIALLSAAVLYLIGYWIRQRRRFKKLVLLTRQDFISLVQLLINKQPGPPHSFFWGHLRVVMDVALTFPQGTHPQILYTEVARRFALNGLFYLDLWPLGPSTIVLGDPELIEKVTVAQSLARHPIANGALQPVLSADAVLGGNAEKLQRAAARALVWPRIGKYADLMAAACQPFCDMLSEQAASSKAVALEQPASALILDLTTRVVFGRTIGRDAPDGWCLSRLKALIGEMERCWADSAATGNPIRRIRVRRHCRRIREELETLVSHEIGERLKNSRLSQLAKTSQGDLDTFDFLMLELMNLDDGAATVGNRATHPLTTREVQLISSR